MSTKENAKQRLAELDTLREEVARLAELEPILNAAVEGKTIQSRVVVGGAWFDNHSMSFDGHAECYRVKPNVIKTKRYWYQGRNGRTVGVYTYGVSGYPHGFESWIDTEWSELEVPE